MRGWRHATRASFFDARLEGCKLTGSVFVECTLRPMAVVGGVWRSVTIARHLHRQLRRRGGNLTGLDLSGVDLREADLSMSDLTHTVLRGATLDGVDLAEALLHDTRLDLQGAVLLAEQHGASVDASYES